MEKCFSIERWLQILSGIKSFAKLFCHAEIPKPQFSEVEVKKHFPVMADWMQLPGKKIFPTGEISILRHLQSRPNVVLVMCESFSMYKSSMSGNPLNTTPYLIHLAKSGIFFERCFTPHFSTARGLFAMLRAYPMRSYLNSLPAIL